MTVAGTLEIAVDRVLVRTDIRPAIGPAGAAGLISAAVLVLPRRREAAIRR